MYQITQTYDDITETNGIQDTNFFMMLSEMLCSNGGIIELPDGAKYSLQDAMNVLLYASVSCSNSTEAAATDLRRKYPKAEIPSADTVHNYMKGNNIDHILSFFRNISSEFIDLINIPNKPQDVAIDFHDIGYFGDKNTTGVRGIKPKNGTSFGYSYLTIDLIGDFKLTPDIINITGLNKNYGILINGILERIQSIEIKVRSLFMDREFFNLKAILTLHDMGIDYIMAASSNQRINRLLDNHIKKRQSSHNHKIPI